MAEVLVLAEHTGGEVKKVTLELLTFARQFGEPAVAWAGTAPSKGRRGWLNTAPPRSTSPAAATSPIM